MTGLLELELVIWPVEVWIALYALARVGAASRGWRVDGRRMASLGGAVLWVAVAGAAGLVLTTWHVRAVVVWEWILRCALIVLVTAHYGMQRWREYRLLL